jgi:uncharacterized protein YndB with AHSA1/START domain
VSGGRRDPPGLPVALEQSLLIAASPRTVWGLWTRPEGLRQWWGAAEVDATPGGVIRVAIGADTVPAPGSPNGPVMRGRFVELDPPQRLVFSFGWESDPPAGPMPPESTTVEVTLTPHDGGTLLLLRHTDLPPHQAADHTTGWTHYLGVLTGAATRREPT